MAAPEILTKCVGIRNERRVDLTMVRWIGSVFIGCDISIENPRLGSYKVTIELSFKFN